MKVARGWRWPGWARGLPVPVVDGLLAAGAGWLAVASALGDARRGAYLPKLGVVLLVALVPALWVRRRWPAVTLLMVAGIQLGLSVLRVQPSANFLVEMVAPYSVALYGSRRAQRISAVAAGVVVLALALPLGLLRPSDRGGVVGLLVGGVVAWLVGTTIRERRGRFVDLAERAARLERERELEARRAVAEERLRIARELHDVVAHNLSVVVVQAQAAQRMLDRDTERVRGVVASIEGTGREALDEMRQLLGVLRGAAPGGAAEGDGEGGEFGPQPGLARLGELVEQVRAAGLPVSLRVEGAERRLGAAADLSAFRIVQEALTNTLKHAGPAHAEVVLRYGERDLELMVSDDGRGAAAAIDRDRGHDQGGAGLPSSGHGLVGMRERVALFGGELTAGPRPGGGYQIRARLPLEVAVR